MQSVRHSRKNRRTGRPRSTPSPRLECLAAKLSCWRSEVARKAAEGNLASLLDFLCYSRLTFLCYLVMFSCFLSQTPTSCPTPSPRHSPGGSWASPSGLAPQASSSPSSIFQASLLHSLTHSLALTPQSSAASLFKNEGVQFFRPGRGEAAVGSCAALAFPPHAQQPGVRVVVSQGDGDCQPAPRACKPLMGL